MPDQDFVQSRRPGYVRFYKVLLFHPAMFLLNLFDTNDYEKLEKMDETIDQIRKRYGNDSVIRAAFLGGCIDHMSGGISREKRSVDYEKLKTE